jgi:tetratricopeptide (TPR) repeat protein
VEILESLPAMDRVVEALIELGCAYRDLAKVIRGPLRRDQERDTSRITETVKENARKGQQALRRAADIAKNRGIVGRQIDALVNLAWLHYYVLEDEQALSILQEAQELIPQEFYITERGRPQIDRGETVVPTLMQLGKIALLCGQIRFNEYQRRKDSSSLEQAIEHYVLSLEYDSLASDQVFRDMRRGMDRIYERLSTLSPQELADVGKMVGNIEEKYNLRKSRMQQFLRESYVML